MKTNKLATFKLTTIQENLIKRYIDNPFDCVLIILHILKVFNSRLHAMASILINYGVDIDRLIEILNYVYPDSKWNLQSVPLLNNQLNNTNLFSGCKTILDNYLEVNKTCICAFKSVQGQFGHITLIHRNIDNNLYIFELQSQTYEKFTEKYLDLYHLQSIDVLCRYK